MLMFLEAFLDQDFDPPWDSSPIGFSAYWLDTTYRDTTVVSRGMIF